jgi:CheY-specific phosphatase CheX
MLAWLRAVERITGRAAASKSAAAKPASARPTAAAVTDPVLRVVQSAAWQVASTELVNSASKFLTLPIAIGDVAQADSPLAHASAIVLSNVEAQLEIRVAVAADATSARALAMHVFGEECDEMLGDMVGELANLFIGAMKTKLSACDLPFTGGLPAKLDTDQVLRPSVTFKHQDAFAFLVNGARLVVHLGLRSKANAFVVSAQLVEGMVLAKEVFNARGVLLLAAGTRLSLSMIDKIRNALAPKQQVEVMTP